MRGLLASLVLFVSFHTSAAEPAKQVDLKELKGLVAALAQLNHWSKGPFEDRHLEAFENDKLDPAKFFAGTVQFTDAMNQNYAIVLETLTALKISQPIARKLGNEYEAYINAGEAIKQAAAGMAVVPSRKALIASGRDSKEWRTIATPYGQQVHGRAILKSKAALDHTIAIVVQSKLNTL